MCGKSNASHLRINKIALKVNKTNTSYLLTIIVVAVVGGGVDKTFVTVSMVVIK